MSKRISLGTPPVALIEVIKQSNTSCLFRVIRLFLKHYTYPLLKRPRNGPCHSETGEESMASFRLCMKEDFQNKNMSFSPTWAEAEAPLCDYLPVYYINKLSKIGTIITTHLTLFCPFLLLLLTLPSALVLSVVYFFQVLANLQASFHLSFL